MKKIIGITPRIIYEDKVKKEFVNTRYHELLDTLDLNYLMLNINNPNIDEILSLCDGFLITGGGDLNPETYNQVNTKSRDINDLLDLIDFQVLKHAIENNKPVLGICRGLQVINVFFGGSLYQDITHADDSCQHETIIAKTKQIVITNSYHHQAIDRLGKDLEIMAYSTDGYIEAIKHQKYPIIGVQWHPEITKTSDDYLFMNLFKSFF